MKYHIARHRLGEVLVVGSWTIPQLADCFCLGQQGQHRRGYLKETASQMPPGDVVVIVGRIDFEDLHVSTLRGIQGNNVIELRILVYRRNQHESFPS